MLGALAISQMQQLDIARNNRYECCFLMYGINLKVVLLLLTFCLLLLPLWESVIILCFVVRYFMSILVLQSS